MKQKRHSVEQVNGKLRQVGDDRVTCGESRNLREGEQNFSLSVLRCLIEKPATACSRVIRGRSSLFRLEHARETGSLHAIPEVSET